MPSAGIVSALSDYLSRTRRLLRDANGTLYSDLDLTSYINAAIKQRDLDIGLNRVRLAYTLTAGTFSYTFNTLAAGSTLLAGATNGSLQDIASIVLMPLGGANSAVRWPMGRWPYSKIAFLLSTAYPSYPVFYAIYGASTLIVAPPPAQAYPIELDCIAYSPDLVGTNDQDPLPFPFTDPVPFMAAAFAKQGVQRFDEADKFEAAYDKRLNRVRSRARPYAVQTPMSDLPRR